MELLGTISSIIFGGILLYLLIREYLKVKKDQKIINSKLDNNTVQTADIRIGSMVAVNVAVNFGSEYDYCKFYFNAGEVFLKFRYSFPADCYTIPLVLKKNEHNYYSYFCSFTVTQFEPRETEAKIHFKNKTFIGSAFTLYLKNISEEDLELLKKNLS
ncbi:hypothetical protein [Flavobacterium phycosphaerae]|uniref:hypothetical protein n=1 Tax=Flavobacterium phycosphaerae TaxID=2697515 RepID=UPI00138ADDA3|nr:hypothetical protein [Flavobacterium phycosphaerae]